MDAPYVFSTASSAGHPGVPVPLDGEIIPPSGRTRPEPETPREAAPRAEAAAPRKAGAGNLLIGVTLAALFGLGAAGGYYFWDRVRALDATVLSLRQVQHEVVSLKSGVETLKGSTELARQDDTIRGLKKTVETLKAELEASRNAAANASSQLAAKIDKTDREPTARLAELSSRLDKIEAPSAKLGDLTARLDRLERQVSSPVTTGSIASPKVQPQTAVQQAAAMPTPEKTQPKPATLGNWIVRDVYDGIALVEGRGGGIREVTPGEMLPGAGEVRAIERRGRNWIVVTSRGIIDDSTW